MNLTMQAFDRLFRLQVVWSRKRPEEAVGYTNRCKDGHYIVVLDYDNLEYEWIVEEVKRLQKDFCLGTFHIFSSGNGYHAVCLDKLLLSEYLMVLHASSVDAEFYRIPLTFQRRCWTLRLTTKRGVPIRHMMSIDAASPRVESAAHRKLLVKMRLLDDGLDALHKPDDEEEELTLAAYRT